MVQLLRRGTDNRRSLPFFSLPLSFKFLYFSLLSFHKSTPIRLLVQLLRRDTDNRSLSLHFSSFHVFQVSSTSSLLSFHTSIPIKLLSLPHSWISSVKDTKWTTTLPSSQISLPPLSPYLPTVCPLTANRLYGKSCLCLPMVTLPQHLVMPGTEQMLSKYSLSQWQNEFKRRRKMQVKMWR